MTPETKRGRVALYRSALAREDAEPLAAALDFRRVARGTVDIDLGILFAGLIGLPVAYAISYVVAPWAGSRGGLLALAILCVVGAGPAALLHGKRDAAIRRGLSGLQLASDPFTTAWFWWWYLVLLLFGDALQLALMSILGSILVVLLVVLPYDLINYLATGSGFTEDIPLPLWIAGAASGTSLVFLVVASNVRLRPLSVIRIAREIPLGLRSNREKVLSFLGSSLLILLFAGAAARYDLLYTNFALGVLLFALDGYLLGSTLCRASVDPPLSALAQISCARSELRRSNRVEAYYELDAGLDRLGPPLPYELLGQAMLILLKDGLEDPEARSAALATLDSAWDEFRPLSLTAGQEGREIYGDFFRENRRKIAKIAGENMDGSAIGA